MQVKCDTFDFLEEVGGSEPGEDLVAGMLELDGSLQSKLHLIHPADHPSQDRDTTWSL